MYRKFCKFNQVEDFMMHHLFTVTVGHSNDPMQRWRDLPSIDTKHARGLYMALLSGITKPMYYNQRMQITDL